MHHAANYLVSGLILAVIAAYVLVIIGAFVSILRSRLSGGMKFVWCVFMVIAPFVGALLWFFIGKKNAERRPHPVAGHMA